MATLSAVISAYNEEDKIGECLTSVAFADEIILVNSSSSDHTPEIAKKSKAKVFTRPNNPMLNINKNYGMSKATSDWILYLDADERVTPELKQEIVTILKQDPPVSGYWIPRKNIIFGKWMEHAGWYPDYQMRLIRRGKGKFPEKHVHEMIEVEGTTEYLNEDLLHYNFETISQFVFKHAERYAPNEAENLIKNGYKFTPFDSIRMPLAEFLSRFFAREGYKDGLHGLILSLLLSFYHLLIFAKIWEKEKFKEHNNSRFFDLVGIEFKKGFNEMQYWFANEKLKRSKNLLEQTLLRVQRKIKS